MSIQSNTQPWDWYEQLIAELAVLADRDRRNQDEETEQQREAFEAAMQVARDTGLCRFVYLYLAGQFRQWGK